MIDSLLMDIKNYIDYLGKNEIYVSIHTAFTEEMLPILEYNYHQNPICFIHSNDNQRTAFWYGTR